MSIQDMHQVIEQNKILQKYFDVPSDILQNIIHGNNIPCHSDHKTFLNKVKKNKLPHLQLSKLPSIQPLKIKINHKLFQLIKTVIQDPRFDPNTKDDNGDFDTIALIAFYTNGCNVLLKLQNELKHYHWNKIQNISGTKFKLIDIALIYNNIEFIEFLLQKKCFPSLYSSKNGSKLYNFYTKNKFITNTYFNKTIKEIIWHLLLNETPNINDLKAIKEHQCSKYISKLPEITAYFVYEKIYKGYLLSFQTKTHEIDTPLQNKLIILYYLISENGSIMHKINGYSAIYYLCKIKCKKFINILIKEKKLNIYDQFDDSKETLYNLILRTFHNDAKYIKLIQTYKTQNSSFTLSAKEIIFRREECNKLENICNTKIGFWNTIISDSDDDYKVTKKSHFGPNIKAIQPNTLDLIELGDEISYNNIRSLVIHIDKSQGKLSLESPICHEYDQIYRKQQDIIFNKHTIKVCQQYQ